MHMHGELVSPRMCTNLSERESSTIRAKRLVGITQNRTDVSP